MLLAAHGLALLLLNGSLCQRQHMVVNEGFQTLAGVHANKLRLRHFNQRLQEMLKVHVRLVAVN